MKEYIKLFNDLESADGYIIADIPFTSTVKRDSESLSPQNVRCNVENKKLVVNGETVEVVENVKPTPLNTILHLNNAPDVELTATTITSGMTSPYKSALIGLEIGKSVTSIGNMAFYGCSGLTSVTISNSVTSIGDSAFDGCRGLTNVTIPDSVTSIGKGAFEYCSSLTSVTIPSSVTTINVLVFSACSNLTGITIPSSVTTIDSYAFSGCTRLSSITIPDSVTSIYDHAFSYCSGLTSVTIGSGLTSIGNYGFLSNCQSLVSITVDSNNTKYDSRNNCNAIIVTSSNTLILGCKNTDIPSSVTTIGKQAFYQCAGLASITIPDSVTKIDEQAFHNCEELTSILIGSGITSIATTQITTNDAAFSGCYALTSVTVDSNNTRYDSRDNCNAIIATQTNSMLLGCQTTVIPNSVTNINSGAFAYRKAPSALTISSNIQSIDVNAFYRCIGLTSLVIPNTITISSEAFKFCSTLTSANINSGTIAYQAFYGCTALTATLGSGVTSIGNGAFGGVPLLIYAGSATGSPWAAKFVCAVYENGLAYSDAAKTRLKKCVDTTLTAVTIPSSVTTIEGGAFINCTSLSSITIPSSVTSIGDNAFSGCTSLPILADIRYTDTEYTCLVGAVNKKQSSYTIPSTVKWICYSAFQGCTGVTNIDIPSGVTSIGSNAFAGIYNINYTGSATGSPWGAKYRNAYVDGDFIYTSPEKTILQGCKESAQGEITIPSTVTTINANAFQGCTGITSVVIPTSVTTIDSYAFYYGYGADYSSTSPCPITAFTCNNVTYTVYDDAYDITITLNNGTSVTLYLWTYYCFLAGTQITLADGTTKAIENIEYTDELKVWNFDDGCYDTAYPMWISKPGTMERYFIITLDDGTVLKVSGANSGHKIYNVDENKFEGCVSIEVGTHVYTESGIKEIVSKETINEPITYYNLMTYRHINCFAEGILTSMRYNSIYPFSEDMKFIKDGRELRPYSEFEAVGISRYWYDGLRLAEQTDSLERINAYVKRLEKKMLPKE